tara:strand:- start:314 stop:706 length:393 start_codon:yes stop_codon:yes gene_type:complete
MKRFWQLIALTLLALLVPASVCCLDIEMFEGVECSCHSAPDQEHDIPAQPSSCPSDTIAHSQVPAFVALPEMQMVELAGLIQAMIRLQDELATTLESFRLPLTTAPPEMRTTWHFTRRAALLARAPSILA